MRPLSTLHLFCRVVDNFGDIGVSWRLARQLRAEHGFDVVLWVDDLASFARLRPEVDTGLAQQCVEGVVARRWDADAGSFDVDDIADVVIEAFGCRLPENYVAAMARRPDKPVWINLEYLSAEAWVEGCHGMHSVHPTLPLTKYFFFPGFSPRTGGLPMERDLPQRRAAFGPKEAGDFLRAIGCQPVRGASLVSLFCYPHAPVVPLLLQWSAGDKPMHCLVPDGIAAGALTQVFGRVPRVGETLCRGSLTVQGIPFLNQDDYDRLLWSCDLNFVRGEDSFVRAQWAARPFVWQIYPQDEGAHLVKLQAFLDRLVPVLPEAARSPTAEMFLAWNAAASLETAWPAWRDILPELDANLSKWSEWLRKTGDLATNLVAFIRTREIG